jgi:hypothetical protein
MSARASHTNRTEGQLQPVEVLGVLLHAVREPVEEAEEEGRQFFCAGLHDDGDGEIDGAALSMKGIDRYGAVRLVHGQDSCPCPTNRPLPTCTYL